MTKQTNKANQEELSFEDQLLVNGFKELLVHARTQADAAPSGTVIDCIEGVFMGQGRELLRRSLESVIQQQAEATEKKSRAAARGAVDKNAGKAPRSGT